MRGPADDLPQSVFGGNGRALGVGVEQQQGLEVAAQALGDHVLPPCADLPKTAAETKPPVTLCYTPGHDWLNPLIKNF